MKYLIETTEVYRADTQEEAEALIEEAKATGVLAKYSYIYKEKKSKGEVIDNAFLIQLHKKYYSFWEVAENEFATN